MASKKAARKSSAKKAGRKAAKKSVKKATKKRAKKAAKKSVKKAVKKAAKKGAKKAAKKSVRKAPKKSAKKATRKAATTRKGGRGAAGLKADRARVSKQGPELAYVARKFGVTSERVAAAIDKVGNMRVDVYAALESFKARSKAADRAKVSRQPHEVALLAKKFSTSKAAVLKALGKHGSSRKKIEKALGGK